MSEKFGRLLFEVYRKLIFLLTLTVEDLDISDQRVQNLKLNMYHHYKLLAGIPGISQGVKL